MDIFLGSKSLIDQWQHTALSDHLGGTISPPGGPGAQSLEDFWFLIFQVFWNGFLKMFSAKKVTFLNCPHQRFWMTSNSSNRFEILVLAQAAILKRSHDFQTSLSSSHGNYGNKWEIGMLIAVTEKICQTNWLYWTVIKTTKHHSESEKKIDKSTKWIYNNENVKHENRWEFVFFLFLNQTQLFKYFKNLKRFSQILEGTYILLILFW